MKFRKILAASCLLGSVLLFTACGAGNDEAADSNNTSSNSSSAAESSETTASSSSVDLNALELPQLTTDVAANEDVVELVTSKGNIKIKLFPEIAPKAVENFMTHAKKGYYDGVIFHRVINEFMIQSGDPEGTGLGGESIWGEPFEMEISNQLYNIRGALAMARTSDPVSQGSQFYIIQNDQDQSGQLSSSNYPKKIVDAYKSGGYPSLDGQYTVFGQVIEGMDVVDAIAKVATDANDKPTEDITIKSINIVQEAK